MGLAAWLTVAVLNIAASGLTKTGSFGCAAQYILVRQGLLEREIGHALVTLPL